MKLTVDDVRHITNGRCAYCGCLAQVIEHIWPLSARGPDVIENCIPACVRCNVLKGAEFVDGWFRHKLALRVLNWPLFPPDHIAWLRKRGFDLSDYDNFKFWFEGDKSAARRRAKARIDGAETMRRASREAEMLTVSMNRRSSCMSQSARVARAKREKDGTRGCPDVPQREMQHE
jgi:hypothetical protein